MIRLIFFSFFFSYSTYVEHVNWKDPHGGHEANFILAPSWFVDLHISEFIAFQELNISL